MKRLLAILAALCVLATPVRASGLINVQSQADLGSRVTWTVSAATYATVEYSFLSEITSDGCTRVPGDGRGYAGFDCLAGGTFSATGPSVQSAYICAHAGTDSACVQFGNPNPPTPGPTPAPTPVPYTITESVVGNVHTISVSGSADQVFLRYLVKPKVAVTLTGCSKVFTRGQWFGAITCRGTLPATFVVSGAGAFELVLTSASS